MSKDVYVVALKCRHSSKFVDLSSLKFVDYTIDEFCEVDPMAVARLLMGRNKVVLLAYADRRHSELIERAVERAGLNPYLVEVVDLRLYAHDDSLLEEAVRVATAKLRSSNLAYGAKLKPVLREKMSRRKLLQALRELFLRYYDAPIFLPELCGRRLESCRICVSSCAFGAIKISGRLLEIDDAKCTACGACSAACPVGALQSPALEDSQLFEAIKLATRPILITCSLGLEERARSRREVNAVVLRASCISSIPLAHVIFAHLIGKRAILWCPSRSCELEPSVRTAGGRWSVAEGALGVRVLYVGGLDLTELKPLKPRVQAPAEFKGRRDLMLRCLTEVPLDVTLVDLDVGASCTLCGLCERICPDDAIEVVREGDEVLLKFNALKCSGCRLCEAKCPEGAITVRTDAKVKEPIGVKMRSKLIRCKNCGEIVGPESLINKVRASLGQMPSDYLYLCDRCRTSFGSAELLTISDFNKYFEDSRRREESAQRTPQQDLMGRRGSKRVRNVLHK